MRLIQFLTLVCVIVYVYGRISDGYTLYRAAGKGYKLMYQAEDWNSARANCELDGGSLAVPKTQDEFLFIQRMVRGMYLPYVTGTSYKLLVWLGINNLGDYMVWTDIDGVNIMNGFNRWAGNNGISYSDSLAEPHCAGVDAINPGLRDWWCHRRQPYICEKKLDVL